MNEIFKFTCNCLSVKIVRALRAFLLQAVVEWNCALQSEERCDPVDPLRSSSPNDNSPENLIMVTTKLFLIDYGDTVLILKKTEQIFSFCFNKFWKYEILRKSKTNRFKNSRFQEHFFTFYFICFFYQSIFLYLNFCKIY